MTGYAVATSESAAGTLTIEIKSVNSRFLDLQFRINDDLRALEPDLRTAIMAAITRGKVEIRLSFGRKAAGAGTQALNIPLLNELARLQAEVNTHFSGAHAMSVAELLRWPGVVEEAQIGQETLQADVAALMTKTVGAFVNSRQREGAALEAMLISRIEAILPQPLSAPDWASSTAWRYRKRSSGHGVLEPVRHVAAIRLADLKEIDAQKEKIQRNTLQFVEGHPANNVLLTGARGTGKSSLIKACLNEYAPQGLRLIEVDKADLIDSVKASAQICRALGREPPETFIFELFLDQNDQRLGGHPVNLVTADEGETADVRNVTPGYLATVGTRLLEGRHFTAADDSTAPPEAVALATQATGSVRLQVTGNPPTCRVLRAALAGGATWATGAAAGGRSARTAAATGSP